MPAKIKVYNKEAQAAGEIELVDNIWNIKLNESLIHQAMVAQMANSRQVLAHTKGRSEVRGGGKKPWRQKGTGRARAGSSRSPIWIGGGVTFGPTKDRNFKKDINRKMRQKALFMALTDKAKGKDTLIVLDALGVDEYKTKKIDEIVSNLEGKILKKEAVKNAKRSFLMIDSGKDEKLKYSARNLAGVKLLNLENINLLDLLKYKNLILTKTAVEKLEEKYK
jgi:large subunit ribosomal protein L4